MLPWDEMIVIVRENRRAGTGEATAGEVDWVGVAGVCAQPARHNPAAQTTIKIVLGMLPKLREGELLDALRGFVDIAVRIALRPALREDVERRLRRIR
jgi:hypothetical protein